MEKKGHILMIGMDAAELTLIDKLCSEGKLPTIQFLRDNGCFGSLESNAKSFTGGVWPTFYTSKDVPWHGIYHNKLWRYENMRCEVANDRWLPEKPFWEIFDQDKFRIALIDVPMTVGSPKSMNGIQLAGWGTHDLIVRGSWPHDLWKELEKKFGPPIMPPEFFGPQNAKSLLKLKDFLIKTTDQMALISESLFVRENWDLFFVVFGTTHRGGHYLWDLSQIDKTGLSSAKVEQLNNALIDIYQNCDRAVGRLISKAPQNTRIIVFAVHGMGLNPGWSDRCAEILSRIQQKKTGISARPGFIYKMKQVVPWQFTRKITSILSQEVLNHLVTIWSANMFDWSTTQYFPLPMDHAGYIRINVKGREPQGIVEPIMEYDMICTEIEDAFLSFFDIETKEPIVEKVYRMDDLAPQTAPYREFLPDLVIIWNDVSAIQSHGIRSDKYGEIHWDSKLPSGRSGNHQANGWFVAAGEGIRPGTHVEGHKIIDLVPTIFQWIGKEMREDFQGIPIRALIDYRTPPIPNPLIPAPPNNIHGYQV